MWSLSVLKSRRKYCPTGNHSRFNSIVQVSAESLIFSRCNPDINHYECIKNYVNQRLRGELECYLPHQVYDKHNGLNDTCVNMTVDEGKKKQVNKTR